ncbi:MAG: hypothetical protein S4CHLAM123_01480 [Chlamydiales bacterium]|nr:hypothetical protein [Chlamydiales bacterium]
MKIKNKLQKKLWLTLLLLIPLGLYILPARAEAPFISSILPTHYSYSAQTLQHLHSTHLMSDANLLVWKEALKTYFETHNTSSITQLRFYTYFYLAQRDAAFFSYNVNQCFLGSLDPLNQQLVLNFFPDFSNFPELKTDAYSEELAHIVLVPYLKKMEAEDNHLETLPGTFPNKFDQVAHWIPWAEPLLLPPAPPPLSDKKFWEAQLNELHQIQAHLTEKQRALVFKWENIADEKWLDYANLCMEENKLPFAKKILIHSLLMMSFYDGFLSNLSTKYTYNTPRPTQMSSEMEFLIPTPGDPSYPSGHAMQGAIAGTILSYFFPQQSVCWEELGQEEGESRLYAGVHFPNDVQQGALLGKKIAQQSLDTLIDSYQ